MTYLNIILTFIFIVYMAKWLTMIVLNYQMGKEHEKAVAYQKSVNEESLELHWQILDELKKR